MNNRKSNGNKRNSNRKNITSMRGSKSTKKTRTTLPNKNRAKKPELEVNEFKRYNPRDRKKTTVKSGITEIIYGSRIRMLLIFFIVLFLALLGVIINLQFVRGDELKRMEYNQSISSIEISAKRGIIYDCNKKALAISANVDTITVNPSYMVVKSDGVVNESKTKDLRERIATKFSQIFELDYAEVLEKLNSKKSVETIISKVEATKVDELRKWLNENNLNAGINIDEDTKRYYPYNNLASNLIGVCGNDNQGLDGIELSYDSILKGTNGKLTTAISVDRDVIPDGDEKYIAPENGSNLYLTIDSNIQTIAEKYLKQAVEENNCKRGGNVIIMDPSNGEIKAMATYPDYNLNDPYVPNSAISDGWDGLNAQDKINRIYTMWRNKAVLDTYEPGSTFKVITASIALEENLAETDTPGDFYCNGSQVVNDRVIRCTATSGHGSETLRNALENSCNPALIQLGQRIGADTFYKYLNAYGFMEKTGVDLPSEGSSSFWKRENVGPVELATMSFGQRFTITPLQLVRAASAIANDGVLVTPHVVKAIENVDTGTIKNIDKNEVRQVISAETAAKMRNMMTSVVEQGGGKNAKVKGYSIGGKTGTSEPDPGHMENGYVASFLAIAPAENTKLVVLLTLYGPQGYNYYGGAIAAPAVSQILSEALPYLDIPSNETSQDANTNLISVPNIKGKTVSEAQKIITASGLKYIVNGTADEMVQEQVPIGGTQLMSGGIIKMYTAGNTDRVSQVVPDLKGVSLAQAKIMLEAKNLNVSSVGTGIVIAQNPKAGSNADEGTAVSVTLQEATGETQH